jgi:hypothetical protein
MTIRIVAGFLAILATGLIAAPVEASARGGGFAGGHGMSFRGGFRAPMIRPAHLRGHDRSRSPRAPGPRA